MCFGSVQGQVRDISSDMRVLFLSYYFEPDLSAGSFRATALIRALSEILPNDSVIDVVTTHPNRYHTFKSESLDHEVRGNVSIHRVQLPAHKNGFIDQALTFRHYAKFVREVASSSSYDIVVGTSSRLMTAVLASYMARRLETKLYLDIRDIFVDTISDVFPWYITAWAVPVFGMLEKYAIKRSNHVNLVSEGFKPYFAPKYPLVNFSYFTNGIDDAFVSYPWPDEMPSKKERIILYAGNMGDGQGLHLIVPELAQELGSGFKFRLIGDGGKRASLIAKVADLGLKNVEILPPVKRDELLEEYSAADILFLHLNDVAAFKKVLPSKLFEYAATGKPMLAGVSGYAEEFISIQIDNARVFSPCDVQAGAKALEELSLEVRKRDVFTSKYSRTKISTMMANEIVNLFKP